MGCEIIIGSGASELFDQKCIGEGDIRAAILAAESDKRYFEGEGGLRICALPLENLTYWVRYRPVGNDTFEVQNAYFHRMKFEEAI